MRRHKISIEKNKHFKFLYLTSKLKVMMASSLRRPLESLKREVVFEALWKNLKLIHRQKLKSSIVKNLEQRRFVQKKHFKTFKNLLIYNDLFRQSANTALASFGSTKIDKGSKSSPSFKVVLQFVISSFFPEKNQSMANLALAEADLQCKGTLIGWK